MFQVAQLKSIRQTKNFACLLIIQSRICGIKTLHIVVKAPSVIDLLILVCMVNSSVHDVQSRHV